VTWGLYVETEEGGGRGTMGSSEEERINVGTEIEDIVGRGLK
jgi:hypothetical protein